LGINQSVKGPRPFWLSSGSKLFLEAFFLSGSDSSVFEDISISCPVRHGEVSLTLQVASFPAAGFVSGVPTSCSFESDCKKCARCLLRAIRISAQRRKLKGVS
jgi:hypothetical protein